MGYLTTITFRNDDIHLFEKYKDETIDMISKAMSNDYEKSRIYTTTRTQSIGNSANPVIIQKSVHADDNMLYLQAGNTTTNLWEVSTDTNSWILDTAIREMEYHLERLKRIKDLKED